MDREIWLKAEIIQDIPATIGLSYIKKGKIVWVTRSPFDYNKVLIIEKRGIISKLENILAGKFIKLIKINGKYIEHSKPKILTDIYLKTINF